jgi:hypothetical protein
MTLGWTCGLYVIIMASASSREASWIFYPEQQQEKKSCLCKYPWDLSLFREYNIKETRISWIIKLHPIHVFVGADLGGFGAPMAFKIIQYEDGRFWETS